MENIKRIERDSKVLAVIVKKGFSKKGLTFVTDENSGLQVGVHLQEKGYLAKAHKHFKIDELKNIDVQEVFYVVKGKVKIGLYSDSGNKSADLEAGEGDLVMVNSAHSLECLSDSKIVEIRLGPYRGAKEKMYFGEK